MNKQDIERAKSDYIKSLTFANSGEIDIACNAFKTGAEWRISSIWHDASEVPIVGKEALVKYITGDGEMKHRIDVFCGYEWREMCHYDKLIQFVYIEDLLPTKED